MTNTLILIYTLFATNKTPFIAQKYLTLFLQSMNIGIMKYVTVCAWKCCFLSSNLRLISTMKKVLEITFVFMYCIPFIKSRMTNTREIANTCSIVEYCFMGRLAIHIYLMMSKSLSRSCWSIIPIIFKYLYILGFDLFFRAVWKSASDASI